MAKKKTATVTDAEVKVTIKEMDADVKRREVHNKNMQKATANKQADEIEQGKELNTDTYEFACDDCLNDAMANGDIFCLYEEKLNEVGRCKCGKLTTHKAILL